MRFFKFAVIAMILAAIFFSCKKDNDKNVSAPPSGNPTPGIEGKWIGTYGFGTETPGVFFSFNIKNSSVIEELNSSGVSKGSGTWSLSGSAFTAHYQWKAPLLTIFSVTANYTSATGKLAGTWGYDNNTANGGKWEMTKQ